MGQNFISCDRGQALLLPPSLTDWLPEDHLVWTVLGAADQMDVDGFYGASRQWAGPRGVRPANDGSDSTGPCNSCR